MDDNNMPPDSQKETEREETEKSKQPEKINETETSEKKEENKTAEQEWQQKKLICAISYIFGILFFLPLIMYPKDDFAQFHANQALAILLVVVIGEVVFGILSAIFRGVAFLGTLFGIICGVFGLVMLIACIAAIVGVTRGEKFELPLIGKIKILK